MTVGAEDHTDPTVPGNVGHTDTSILLQNPQPQSPLTHWVGRPISDTIATGQSKTIGAITLSRPHKKP